MAGEIVKPKVFSCPGCGASLSVTAIGSSTTVVCAYCNSILDANSPIVKLIGKFENAVQYQPCFELNSFGTLRGIKWKIIGFVVREDKEYNFVWDEYLLYNPYNGYRWILKIDGHFSLTERLAVIPNRLENPKLDTNEFDYNSRNYKLFNRGVVQVVYVVGEFYWRVKQGETVAMRDYVSPPFMLSEEISGAEEANYSISEYVSESEINSAFKRAEKADTRGAVGVAANQPNPYSYQNRNILFTVGAVAVLFFIWLSLSMTQKQKILIETNISGRPPQSMAVPDPTMPKSSISESFNIPDSIGNVELRMSSPVNNQWAEAQITLVNETTGEDYTFEEGVEYYSGRDSDGSWSEGSQTGSRLISSVPGGTYHMESEVTGDMQTPSALLVLVRHSGMAANFLAALFLIVFPAIWSKWRERAFEVSRWSNSDYNTYTPLSEYLPDDDD